MLQYFIFNTNFIHIFKPQCPDVKNYICVVDNKSVFEKKKYCQKAKFQLTDIRPSYDFCLS